MDPWDEECLHIGLEDVELFGPRPVDPNGSMRPEELADLEALCEAATCGPLLIDDHMTGEGVVMATLPDGRHIISLTSDKPSDDPATIRANARLICQARGLLLRLLRDRDRWQVERDKLLAKLDSLESALEQVPRQTDSLPPGRGHRVSSLPR